MRGKMIGKFLAILLTATMVVGVSVSCSSEKSTTEKKQTETTEKSDKKADKKKTDVTGKKEVKNDKLKNDKESDTKSDQKVENVKVETNKDNNENKSDKNDNDSKKNNSNNKPSKPDNGGQTEKPQHKHSYSASVTKQPTCSSTGTRTYTCSCGDSYTESIPAVDHHWQHHDATGHYDKVVDQPAWDEPIYETHAICAGCGQDFGPGEAGAIAALNHTMKDFNDSCSSYYADDVQTGTIHHEATYKDVWVQDSPAYDECTNCGARK